MRVTNSVNAWDWCHDECVASFWREQCLGRWGGDEWEGKAKKVGKPPQNASLTQQDTCLLIYLSGTTVDRRFWRRLGEHILNRKLSKSTQRQKKGKRETLFDAFTQCHDNEAESILLRIDFCIDCSI